MSPDQRAMCFCVWKECWTAIRRTPAGTRFADEKAARMAITRKAIGLEKSWSDAWAQKQIDRLLGVMWALGHGDNLELQMRQLEQPFARAEASVYARVYLVAIGIEEGGREAYLNAIAKRIHGKPLCDLDDEEWRDVLSALNHTAMHKQGIAHEHPRSEWQKRKGAGSTRRSSGTKLAGAVPATELPARTGSVVNDDPY